MAKKSEIVAFEKKAKEKNREIEKIDFDRLGITEFRGEKVSKK